MLRRVTETLVEDAEVLKQFLILPDSHAFEEEHVDKVFHAYLRRVETMVGNEYAHQLMEGLLLNKNEKLGSLRQVKRRRDKQVKGLRVEEVDEGVSEKPTCTTDTTSTRRSSRRKRKKKTWYGE